MRSAVRVGPAGLTWLTWLTCLAAVTCLAGASGCQRAPTDIRSAVQLIGEAQGEVAERSFHVIQPLGPRALPYLESALHFSPPPGRRNLLAAVRRLAEDSALAEAAPLVAHFAAYDTDASVRREASWALSLWSARKDALGEAARRGQRKVDEVGPIAAETP